MQLRQKLCTAFLALSLLSSTIIPASAATPTPWTQIDGRWRITNKDGSFQKGWYKDLTYNVWYFLDYTTGNMKTGWVAGDSTHWYYLHTNGIMQTGLVKINNHEYYFETSGKYAGSMVTGEYRTNDMIYTTDDSGRIIKKEAVVDQVVNQPNGWFNDNDKWYYIVDKKKITGWYYIDGKEHYFLKNGLAAEGEIKFDNQIAVFKRGKLITRKYITTKSYTKQELEKIKKDVVRKVNSARTKEGLSELTLLTDEIAKQADVRAQEISTKFDHIRPDGRTLDTICTDINATCLVGENIAYGYTDAEELMKALLDSPAHKKNILNADYQSMTVGIYESNGVYYWVQNFFIDFAVN